ncbi:ABC transporter substrate-binding protein [candidate division TA06 bacterium]|uniref:ABC transporter substrate-binding protein n=1 Tax=candidate division TA06 bacterium TaxID=2250710 RepID=A0A933IBN7_UNCT6|nr:ABC transporter substrate-binding protein [candidate division TA06 bacterium]
MKRFPYFLFLIFFLGCSSQPRPQAKEARTIADDLGRAVRLEGPPSRIISFAPSLTEMIYALGGDDRLAGVTSWCNWPPQARSKTLVGDMMSPNFERMVSLRPQLAVMIGSRPGPLLKKFEALNIPVICFKDETVADIRRALNVLGLLLECPARADSMIKDIDSRLATIKAAVDSVPLPERPKVFAELGSSPLFAAGDSSFIGQMIALAGGINVTGNIGSSYAAVNPELVVKSDPGIIIVLHPQAGRKDIAQRLGWQNVSAVKNGKIYPGLDQDVILRPGPRFIEGLKILHEIFYAP